METAILSLYPALFFYLLIRTKNKKKNVPYVLLLCLYLFAGVCTILYYNANTSKSFISLEAVVYHLITLLLIIIPFKRFNKFSYKKIEVIPEKTLRPFALLLIIFSFISIGLDIVNIDTNRIAADVVGIRQDMAEGGNVRSGLLNYINYYACIYWSSALVIMFYYMAFYPSKKTIIFLLLIASLTVVIRSFTIAGRDIVLKYLFIITTLYFFFRDYMNEDWRGNLKKMMFVLGGLFISFFIFISYLRFSVNITSNTTMSESFLSYAGQPFLFFSDFYRDFSDNGATGGAIHFPLFTGKQMMSRFDLSQTIIANASLNSFSTAVGSWLMEFGAIGAAIVAILHNLIATYVGHRKNNIFTFIYIAWLYEFVFFSLFYYVYTFNLSYVASILFIVVLEKIWNLKTR